MKVYYPSSVAVMKYCGTTLVKASALLLCSLSVLFAYKVGLFNIGAAGQYVIGAGASLYFALKFGMPWYICLIAAVVLSALAGGLSGFLKAYFNVNEVISCIMPSYFIQHITSGGSYVDKTMYCTQISDLISAFIIYLCGFVFFFKLWLNRYLDKRDEKTAAKQAKGGEK